MSVGVVRFVIDVVVVATGGCHGGGDGCYGEVVIDGGGGVMIDGGGGFDECGCGWVFSGVVNQ